MECEIQKGKDTSLEELFKKFKSMEDIEIEAGFIRNVMHPREELTLPQIAAIQQYGTKAIPSRPFLTDGAVIAVEEISKHLAESVEQYLRGRGIAAFEPVAKASKEGIIKAIRSQRFKKLSPRTLEIRRDRGNHSETILIDEGYMINSIETKVKRGKK